MINRDRFREALDDFYSKDILFKLFKSYFIDWIADGYIGSNLGLFEVSVISEDSKKQTLLDLMYQVFSKEETFKNIYGVMDEELQEIFLKIAWHGKYYISESEKEKFFRTESGYTLQRELDDKYLFFKYVEGSKKENPYMYLHNDVVRMMRPYLPKARDYYLHPADALDYSFKHGCEDEIASKFTLYYNFFVQGNIKMTSSDKMLKAVKKDMQKYCGINEYYSENKDLDFLKTETVGLFFLLIKEEYLKPENFRISNLKYIMTEFLNGRLINENGFCYTSKYLNYLKGTRNIWDGKENIKRCMESIGSLIAKLPEDTVVSVENILNYLVYRDEFLEILNPKDVYDYVYINEADYGRTRVTSYDMYYKYIIEPFVKSVLFILGSFGILEVYYNSPSISNGLYLKNGYLSKYDGLAYIKLSKLGEYIVGKSENYNFGDFKEEAEVMMDDDRLILSIVGEAPMKIMYLEQVAQRIGENKYKFTYENFLKNIESEKQLKERVDNFKQKICSDLTGIWEEFFAEIYSRLGTVELVEDVVVMKLKKDKDLIGIIGADEELKKYILKAEDFHILVKVSDKDKVLARLKSFGYFNDI